MAPTTNDGDSSVPCERTPPKRNPSSIEHELFPAGASWLDLMPENADRSARFVFACLEYGVLEAWQDAAGVVRLYLPECCGGHLIVAGPDDGALAPDLDASGPHYTDPDALVRRPGATWIPLLPGIRRARTRPKPTPNAHRPQEATKDP